jgi:sodium transport system ATP-binding protein
LTKEYRTPGGDVFRAVDAISFTASAGAIFGLLGPNGAGKTTTLRMLSTLIVPTSGTAMVGGHEVSTEPESVRRRIGFLTGSTGLYPRLSAREVVAYFGRLHGMEPSELDARLDSIFDELQITPFQHKR